MKKKKAFIQKTTQQKKPFQSTLKKHKKYGKTIFQENYAQLF